MKIITVFFLFVVFFGYSQTKIRLAKNPYSDENHQIVLLKNDYNRGDLKIYDLKSQRIKYAWKALKIDVLDFKSLEVKGKRNGYDVVIQLDADGILLLDKHTTEYRDESLALVFNDTIYQTLKIGDPILDGRFKISDLTKKQKNNFVATYKGLPSYDIQKQLYSAIQSHKIEKIDSLLENGAQLIDGGYKIGPNNFKNVIYDLFRSKNSKYEKYSKTINHLLKKGFVPNPKNLNQAIVFEDIDYVRNFFMSEKDVEKRKKLVNNKLRYIINNGSLELLKLTENMGLNLEKITFGRDKKTVLMEAVLKGDNEMIGYLLKKNIPYDTPRLFVYSAIYKQINTVDVLLREGVDINTGFNDNSNIAQALVDLEFRHDYFMNNVSLKKIPQLIKRGLDINTVNTRQETILHTLAPYVKKYLGFGRGAYSNYSPKKVAKELIELVNLIKSKGVDPNIKDNDGFTAYDYVLKDIKSYKIEPVLIQKVLNAFK